MVGRWLANNWLAVLTALGILYGIGMSTYNFVELRRIRRRILEYAASMLPRTWTNDKAPE
jgi:hypothetical protein